MFPVRPLTQTTWGNQALPRPFPSAWRAHTHTHTQAVPVDHFHTSALPFLSLTDTHGITLRSVPGRKSSRISSVNISLCTWVERWSYLQTSTFSSNMPAQIQVEGKYSSGPLRLQTKVKYYTQYIFHTPRLQSKDDLPISNQCTTGLSFFFCFIWSFMFQSDFVTRLIRVLHRDNIDTHICKPHPRFRSADVFLVTQEAVVTEEEPLPHRSPKTTTTSSNYRNSTGIIRQCFLSHLHRLKNKQCVSI